VVPAGRSEERTPRQHLGTCQPHLKYYFFGSSLCSSRMRGYQTTAARFRNTTGTSFNSFEDFVFTHVAAVGSPALGHAQVIALRLKLLVTF
jgi:hypothetical protein